MRSAKPGNHLKHNVLYVKFQLETTFAYAKRKPEKFRLVQHNKQYHRKELLSGSHLNAYTIGFHAHTQIFEPLTSAILRRNVSRTSLFFVCGFLFSTAKVASITHLSSFI